MEARRQVRRPAVAGLFYPADPAACAEAARRLLARPADPGRWFAAVVPHAGWSCSGAVAARSIQAVARDDVDLVVVFAAVHTARRLDRAALDTFDAWLSPLGQTPGDAALRRTLARSSAFVIDDRFHFPEHAVEVELPLLSAAMPRAGLLAIAAPPHASPIGVGRAVAEATRDAGRRAVFLASSDLTHYGPDYGFEPGGRGDQAWAMQNDRALLEAALALDPRGVLAAAARDRSACGAGAIAAMLAAATACGADRAALLEHTTSARVLGRDTSENFVDYASLVVGR